MKRFHIRAHVEDLQKSIAFPAAVQDTEQVRRKAFHDAAVMMKRRLDITQSLPLESLDRLAIQKQVREISRQ